MDHPHFDLLTVDCDASMPSTSLGVDLSTDYHMSQNGTDSDDEPASSLDFEDDESMEDSISNKLPSVAETNPESVWRMYKEMTVKSFPAFLIHRQFMTLYNHNTLVFESKVC